MKKIKKKAPPPAKPFSKDTQITIRVPPEIRRWLQSRIEAEMKARPGWTISISDVARDVFFAAMAADAASRGGGSTDAS